MSKLTRFHFPKTFTPNADLKLTATVFPSRRPVKRQRTNSLSSSTPSSKPIPTSSSDEALARKASDAHTTKPALRGAAARNHAQKELNDREKEKERERANAADRRKERAGRRRGDGIPSRLSPQTPVQRLSRSLTQHYFRRISPLGPLAL